MTSSPTLVHASYLFGRCQLRNKTATSYVSFRVYEGSYDTEELASFQQAYDDACRKLGLDPSPTDDTVYRSLRDDLAKAISSS